MREHVVSFLDDCAARSQETAFAVYRGGRAFRWSYGRVRATAFQVARELEARGIGRGDRVLFWADNSAEWVVAFFGCLLRGAIVVPLDAHSAPEFVARVEQQVGARLMLYSLDERRGSALNLPAIRMEELSSVVARHSNEPYEMAKPGREDLVEIIFTSGTTAEPRGVCISHRNLLANLTPIEGEIKKYIKWEKPFHPVRFLNLLPLSHVFGQFMGIFVPQLIGGEVFFQESLNPSETIDVIKRQRISVIVSVPRQLETLREKIERDYEARGRLEEFHKKLASVEGMHFFKRWWIFRDLHSRFGWKFWAFISGGATLNSDTETFWRRLGFVVVQGYGMTETAGSISVNHPFKTKRGSIGETLPGQEVKLDESGEILVRGDNVSPGYWASGVKPLTGEDGWLRTGDIGEKDEAGNLYFKGRKKDVIVTGAGLNIYPEDLEQVLNQQPEVRSSCVIGIEGPRGPEPLAALVLADETTDPAEIIRRANESLSEPQQIRRWHIWPEQDFPRTPTQKIRKGVVAEALEAQVSSDGAAHNRFGTLAEMIASISGDAPATLDPSANVTTDLKLDSLGRVELLSAIEDRYQVEIDEAAFTSATTLGEIEKMIHEGKQDGFTNYPYPEWTLRFPITWIRFIIFYLVMLPITRLMCWARAIGKEHLKDVREPVLFISNHVAMVDQSLILSALPSRFRMSLAVAMEGEKLRLWQRPPEGTDWFTRLRLLAQYVLVVSLVNVFPLPQKSGFRRSFTFAGEAMDRGYSVLVFPEGKRTETGLMNPFMGGLGLLVANLDVAVVPIKLDGLFELKRRQQYFARPGQVTVVFGEPVRFARGEDPAFITKELEARVAAL